MIVVLIGLLIEPSLERSGARLQTFFSRFTQDMEGHLRNGFLGALLQQDSCWTEFGTAGSCAAGCMHGRDVLVVEC